MILYNYSIINNYYEIIRTLRPDLQSELANRIETSLKKGKIKEKTISHLFGAWEGNLTAEELIDSIKYSRVFNRKIIEF